jgi:hypothetical protein
VIKSHVLYQLSYALSMGHQILKPAGLYQSCALFCAGFAKLAATAGQPLSEE